MENQSRTGPTDANGEGASERHLDLGALYVPTIPGMQLRAQFGEEGSVVHRIQLILGSSGIQISVAAAPKSGGLWPELAEQITAAIEKQGGEVISADGVYGPELHARIAGRMPNGQPGFSNLRILAFEGPRWLLRVDLQGAAAGGDVGELERCYDLIDRLIVHRGPEPRIRFEQLPMHLPQGATAPAGSNAAGPGSADTAAGIRSAANG